MHNNLWIIGLGVIIVILTIKFISIIFHRIVSYFIVR